MQLEKILVFVGYAVFVMYAVWVFIMSIRNQEILFQQGRGITPFNGSAYKRCLIYHGINIAILVLILFVAVFSSCSKLKNHREQSTQDLRAETTKAVSE